MEKIDLNALRANAETAGKEPTKEERITELQAKIAELENSPENIPMLNSFLSMDEQEQQKEVERVAQNRDLQPGTYTIETRIEELGRLDNSGPSIKDLRLETFKQELKELLKEQ